MPSPRTNRILRLVAVAVLAVVAVILIAGEWFSNHYKAVIQARLPALSAKATDSLYRITIEDLDINILTRAITITGLRMTPDTAVIRRRVAQGRSPERIYDISIPEVEIRGLKWGGLSTEQELGCRRIRLTNPLVQVFLSTDSLTDTARRPPPQIEHLFARHIRIENPEFRIYRGWAARDLLFHSRGGRISAQDWSYIPGASADSSRFFLTGEADVRLQQVGFGIPKTLYAVSLDTLRFLSADRDLLLRGLQIRPSVNEEEFYRQVGMQREIYSLRFPVIDTRGLDWQALLRQRAFLAREMKVSGADIDVFFSRLPPPNTVNKLGHYPHQLLQRLSTPLAVPLIRLQDCTVRYTEFNNKTRLPATISFTQIAGQATHISNLPADVARDPHCQFRLTGRFMDRSSIAVTFDFRLNSPEGAFGLSARMRDLNGTQLREPARALALAEIKSLQLHELDLQITGNEDTSNGIFRIRYDNLKIKLLRLDTVTMNLRNRPFISFLANNLLLYNDNPMEGDTLRIAYTHIARDPTKPFFNLIWKNLFNGFVQTAIRSEGLTDIVKRKQANKGKPKRRFFKGLFPKRKK